MPGRVRNLLIIAAAVSISGCFFGGRDRCEKPQEYHDHDSIDELRVPGDLDSPAPEERLDIPAPAESAGRVRPECLEKPPDYFGRPVGAPAD